MTNVQQPTQFVMIKKSTRGFALPTILIASIVMLLVLLASVTSTTAVRTAMKDQYYAQLAQVAGEAGVAYAQACLDASARVPTWSDAAPLKSNTDCSGVELVGCPTTSTDVLCSVTRNGNIRSNFSVGLPPTDADGRATTIPNTGYVEVLRTSNEAVWRRYNQKASPAAVVPDLCSGSATSVLGWNNATVYSQTPLFAAGSPAMTIGPSTGNVVPGPVYLRKDFSVTQAGTYTMQVAADNVAEASVDGAHVALATSATTPTAGTVDLSVGCHALVVKLTNGGIMTNLSRLTLTLGINASTAPLVVSDTSWRISSGNSAHYSSVNYYSDPITWTPDKDLGAFDGSAYWGAGPSPNWGTTSGVPSAVWISTVHSTDVSGSSYPSNSTALFRDSRTITVSAPTQIKLSYACDDTCDIWLDGDKVVTTTAGGSVTQTTTLTLSEGSHKFGVALGNGTGPSGFLFAAIRTSDGAMLTRSDKTWRASNFWNAVDQDPSSYDNNFSPNPVPAVASPTGPVITNRILNPSLELGTTDWVVGNATSAWSTIGATNGTRSFALTANNTSSDSYVGIGGNNTADTMRLGVEAGKTYTVSATVHIPTPLTGSLMASNRELGIIAFSWTDQYEIAMVQAPNVTGTYALKMTFTVPSNATRFFLRVYHGGLTGTVYWDSLMFSETDRSMPSDNSYIYRDGSSSGWAWTVPASPHNSTSFGPRI